MSISKPSLSDTWASAPAGGDVVEPSDGIKLSGWTASSACPPYQWFNWLLNKLDAGVRYLLCRGIPDYDAAETNYDTGDCVQFTDGATYRLWNPTGAGQTTPAPPDPTHWNRWGHINTEVNDLADARIALALSSALAPATITPNAGAVSDSQMVKVGAAFKQVMFKWTGTCASSGATIVVFTLSGDAAFGTAALGVQVTKGNGYLDDLSLRATVSGQTATVTLGAGSPNSAAILFLTVTGS